MWKKISYVMTAGLLIVLGTGICEARETKCGQAPIYVVQLDHGIMNKETDMYRGNWGNFDEIASYLLAFKLMWVTGAPAFVLRTDNNRRTIFSENGQSDQNAMKGLASNRDVCYMVFGQVTQVSIDAGKMLRGGDSRRDQGITVSAHLVLLDMTTGKVRIDSTFTGYNYNASRDRSPALPSDPVEAGGGPLGVALSRMFGDFANQASRFISSGR